MEQWRTFKEIEMDKVRIFPIINKNFEKIKNIEYIHPLKQQKISILFNNLNSKKFIFLKKVWIFGSSTNNCCNINSDIDILIELKNCDVFKDIDVYENFICELNSVFSKSVGSNFDVIILNDLDKNKQIYKNILKTRRLIYECND